ncbi:cystathione beta-lyase [Fervidobacterium changbaicum]|uniref:cysteine-S-conjugate beta-lyase n=2 Tax=Fervidobacterium TaxID=2422 RepID=A0AAI8CKK0_FERIS|nr:MULTISPECIES: PatB family C-S lyase [Fervidobacterium]AMW32130.1 PatB family C-S lyase [Fervidobacterium islandicum]QAV33901.1 putative C-S lyase [Fervidobacterium changbaicum]SDH73082.1 cystathione beta-lyase [Fervidobacterium changbaicum]
MEKGYQFDELINRKNTDSFKWDMIIKLYGDDVIPMWVADMDFKSPYCVIEALRKRVEHGVFGYTFRSDEYYEAIIEWYEKSYGVRIEKEWIVNGPGVVPMIAFLINIFTLPGDKVIIQPPVYPPFFKVVENNGRRLVENRLILKDGKWVMDYEGLERSIDKRTKMIVISNPHNPVGRVWTFDELSKLYEIAKRHNILIVSDEIHADIIYEPNSFTSFLKVGKENVIVLNSPGKTFNIAGLTNAYGIISDKILRQNYKNYIESLELLTGNVLSLEALKAAYKCDEWVVQLRNYLKVNRDFAYHFIKEHMPLVKPTLPEGTYLMWLDCSSLGLENPQKFFLENAKVYLNDGAEFGDGQSVRLNFACPRAILKEGLNRLKDAYDKLLTIEHFKLPDKRFEECKRIRHEVFVIGQGIDERLELDGRDEQAIHFLVRHFGKYVATARIRDIGEYWKVERVAVLKEFRGLGYGKKIMEAIESYIKRTNPKPITLNAQLEVREFYEKLGYKSVGHVFYEAGIPHIKMEKTEDLER